MEGRGGFNIFIEVKKSDKIELNVERITETIPSPLFSMAAEHPDDWGVAENGKLSTTI